jgi:hypothetical protein
VTDAAFAKPVALFATLDSIALNEVRAAARTKAIEAGQTFFREGDPAAAFFVLDTGPAERSVGLQPTLLDALSYGRRSWVERLRPTARPGTRCCEELRDQSLGADRTGA